MDDYSAPIEHQSNNSRKVMNLFCFLIANLMKFEKKSGQASLGTIAILGAIKPNSNKRSTFYSSPNVLPTCPLKTTLLSSYWGSELVVKCFLFVCLNTREYYP